MAVFKSVFLTKPILSEKVPYGTTAPLPLLYSSFAVRFSHFVKNHHITTATFLTLLFFLLAGTTILLQLLFSRFSSFCLRPLLLPSVLCSLSLSFSVFLVLLVSFSFLLSRLPSSLSLCPFCFPSLFVFLFASSV